MSESMMDRFSRFMGNNPSLTKVSDDLQLTSELILLVKMIFADGKLSEGELDMFSSLCQSAFGLHKDDIPGILKYLQDFGYETSTWDAAAMFKGYSAERKRNLLVHLLQIAKSDGRVDESEQELIRRTASLLDMTAEDLS